MGAALIVSACQQSPIAPDAVGSGTAVPGQLAARGGGGGAKVDICHREGNGSFHLINVSVSADAMHIARHGDGHPGDPVPNVPGKKFDAACGLVDVGGPPPPPAAVCPCGLTTADLLASTLDPADIFLFVCQPDHIRIGTLGGDVNFRFGAFSPANAGAEFGRCEVGWDYFDPATGNIVDFFEEYRLTDPEFVACEADLSGALADLGVDTSFCAGA